MTAVVTGIDHPVVRQEAAWSALSQAFGSLKRALSGGRRTEAAYRESRMMIYNPPMWDQITKYLQKQKREAWEEQMGAALELEGAALDGLESWEEGTEEAQEARQDLNLARKHFRRLNGRGKPEEKRSSWMRQDGLSHQEALSMMGRLPIKPEVDPQTATESELERLRTYGRIKNGLKALRKRIRAAGGKAR